MALRVEGDHPELWRGAVVSDRPGIVITSELYATERAADQAGHRLAARLAAIAGPGVYVPIPAALEGLT